jgi:hypothetical protein
MSKMRKLEDWQTDRVLKKCACMIAHSPTKGALWPRCDRGWYVREYHSTAAMEHHLNHLKGKPTAPAHWKPGWQDRCHGETGPFRSEEEAREYALGAA